jgi:hypothetical protein
MDMQEFLVISAISIEMTLGILRQSIDPIISFFQWKMCGSYEFHESARNRKFEANSAWIASIIAINSTPCEIVFFKRRIQRWFLLLNGKIRLNAFCTWTQLGIVLLKSPSPQV